MCRCIRRFLSPATGQSQKYSTISSSGVPTQSQRGLLTAHRDEFARAEGVLINVAKGIETATGKCVHEVYADVLGEAVLDRYVVLYGPSHAEEFGRNMPTAPLAASRNQEAAEGVQTIFMNDNVRVYTGKDVVGVELGGALKNISIGIASSAGKSWIHSAGKTRKAPWGNTSQEAFTESMPKRPNR